ncbi:hypothetical protein BSZ39_11420 [Bowdeniella nasicola]|uniref:D-lactate dehydrogenase n=1 Tax=Bowdeniella nasicola TaxID=208480 RepID=A0A1Q5PZM1_9ACTO|nr:NAD(P)-dependent oxidoreductase [Bowdeniella nasicola]OKL53073.1 hypothetical protein BSZ39_11420 [Bowdeniella nasicola]
MTHPIVAYDVRPDELGDVDACMSRTGVEIIIRNTRLELAGIDDLPETDAVSILGQSIVDAELMAALAERGVKYLSTRTVGFDHIDLDAAKNFGITVGHVTYPPNSVAEYTVMLILMTLRRMKLVMHRAQIQDFSLMGSQGSELGNSTVGILGTGRIGAMVANFIKPFGTRVLATDPYPKSELEGIVEYVDLDTMLAESDLVTLHAPASEANHHLIGAERLAKMRKGATIVNCGRGDLIDAEALISALESGHLAGAALDVLENDLEYFHRDVRLGTIRHRNLVLLRSFPNVLVTPHIAFYTREVVSAMVEQSVDSLLEMRKSGTSPLVVGGAV